MCTLALCGLAKVIPDTGAKVSYYMLTYAASGGARGDQVYSGNVVKGWSDEATLAM